MRMSSVFSKNSAAASLASSAMFDWNDEELGNIIWGEAAENDDHIVPYFEKNEVKSLVILGYDNKKERMSESATIKTLQKAPGDNIDFCRSQRESISHIVTDGEFSSSGVHMGSWADISLVDVAKTGPDSLGTDVSNNLAEITDYDSWTGCQISHIKNEDNDRGDFADYVWANIGSFDDLERIFSSDDTIMGYGNLDNEDEVWSSSKDLNSSPAQSFPLSSDSPSMESESEASRNTSSHFKIEGEYIQHEETSFIPGHGEVDDPISHGAKKVNRQANIRKKLEGELQFPDTCATWPQPGSQLQLYEKHGISPMVQKCKSPVLIHKEQFQRHDLMHIQHISAPCIAPSLYGNFPGQYPSMPVWSCIHFGDNSGKLSHGYEVPLGSGNKFKKSLNSPLMPPAMPLTPLEKIEKLRRRQQLHAMLAIQKQRQQFTHQTSCSNFRIQGNQVQHVACADLDVQNLHTLSSFNLHSSTEKDNSGTTSLEMDSYLLDTILFQLQEIVTKLDVKVRLRVHNSLFRLAQSVMHRHFVGDTSSTNKRSGDVNEEFHNQGRIAKVPSAETETNPIDRIVANLLFNGPMITSEKHHEMPDLPLSRMLPIYCKTSTSVIPTKCLPNSPTNEQNLHHGFKVPDLSYFQQNDQLGNDLLGDKFENASNRQPSDGGAIEIEPSH